MSVARVVGICALTSVVVAPRAAAYQDCTAPWLAAAQRAALVRGYQFLLFRRDSSMERDTLAIGVQVASGSSDSMRVVVGRIANTSWVEVVGEWIPTLASRMVVPLSEECYLRQTLWLDAAVVDLALDGDREIVIEYNRVGSCGRCFSEITVLAWGHGGYRISLEAAYSRAEFARGEGLTLQTPQAQASGEVRTVERRYFQPATRRREPRGQPPNTIKKCFVKRR